MPSPAVTAVLRCVNETYAPALCTPTVAGTLCGSSSTTAAPLQQPRLHLSTT